MSPKKDLAAQLERANRIIGWMMPYIGSMCPPTNGLFDLNEHCFENHIPSPGKETKGAPINQKPSISAVMAKKLSRKS